MAHRITNKNIIQYRVSIKKVGSDGKCLSKISLLRNSKFHHAEAIQTIQIEKLNFVLKNTSEMYSMDWRLCIESVAEQKKMEIF